MITGPELSPASVCRAGFKTRFRLNDMGIKELIEGWSFTEIGGGEGTRDGEWLNIEQVPATVHVELLNAKRIPDPVSRFSFCKELFESY